MSFSRQKWCGGFGPSMFRPVEASAMEVSPRGFGPWMSIIKDGDSLLFHPCHFMEMHFLLWPIIIRWSHVCPIFFFYYYSYYINIHVPQTVIRILSFNKTWISIVTREFIFKNFILCLHLFVHLSCFWKYAWAKDFDAYVRSRPTPFFDGRLDWLENN